MTTAEHVFAVWGALWTLYLLVGLIVWLPDLWRTWQYRRTSKRVWGYRPHPSSHEGYGAEG